MPASHRDIPHGRSLGGAGPRHRDRRTPVAHTCGLPEAARWPAPRRAELPGRSLRSLARSRPAPGMSSPAARSCGEVRLRGAMCFPLTASPVKGKHAPGGALVKGWTRAWSRGIAGPRPRQVDGGQGGRRGGVGSRARSGTDAEDQHGCGISGRSRAHPRATGRVPLPAARAVCRPLRCTASRRFRHPPVHCIECRASQRGHRMRCIRCPIRGAVHRMSEAARLVPGIASTSVPGTHRSLTSTSDVHQVERAQRHQSRAVRRDRGIARLKHQGACHAIERGSDCRSTAL